MNSAGTLREGKSTIATQALKTARLLGLQVGVWLRCAHGRAWLCHGAALEGDKSSPLQEEKIKSIVSDGCLGFKEPSSSHKEFLSSYSTSNVIIYRSGTYDRGTEGPHRGPRPHCAKRRTNTEQRDHPFPKELTSKHKMEKSHY